MFLLRNRYATLVVAALLVAAGVVALRVDAGAIPSAGAPAAAAVDVATVASQTITDWHERSEEHTSELQSLMRISYAVFCLKKKKRPTQTADVTPSITPT